MSDDFDTPTVRDFLAHEAFLRKLATQLLRDQSDIDDVLQQTWLAALESPPRQRKRLRGWLATVTRNFIRRRYLFEQRRTRREHAAATREGLSSASDEAERLETKHLIAEATLRLEEPYRSTIVLRFFEGLQPIEIAHRQGVPSETVRSRLRRAMAMLRARLESSTGDDRTSWRALLVPVATGNPLRARGTATRAPARVTPTLGVFLMSTKLKIGAIGLAVFGAAAWLTWSIGVSGDVNRPASSRLAPTDSLADAANPRRSDSGKSSLPNLGPVHRNNESASSVHQPPAVDELAMSAPCEVAALRQALEDMAQHVVRGNVELADRLQESIFACGDFAVRPVATVLDRQDALFERCLEILTSLNSELSIRAVISGLKIEELSQENALRLKEALAVVADERWLGDLRTVSFQAPSPRGRSTSAWLLGRVPTDESVAILVAALEREDEEQVQHSIVSALLRLGARGLRIPMDRLLERVDAGQIALSSQLSHLIAAQLPWQDASAWLLAHFQERWATVTSTQEESIELPNVLLSGLQTVLQEGGAGAEQVVVDFLTSLEGGEGSNDLQRGLVLEVLGDAQDGSVAAPALERIIHDSAERQMLRESAVSVLSELATRSPVSRRSYLEIVRSSWEPGKERSAQQRRLREVALATLPYHLARGEDEVLQALRDMHQRHAESRSDVLRVVERAILRESPGTTWTAGSEDPLSHSILATLLRDLELTDDGRNATVFARLTRLLADRVD